MVPLGFAVPYFIDSVSRGENKSFITFFHVYKALLPYLGAKLFGMFVAIICLMPLFFSLYNLLHINCFRSYSFADINNKNGSLCENNCF
jgi:hypothetical protein